MTYTTNARIAGVAFLAYIGTGIADLALFGSVARGPDAAAKLANLAQHVTTVRVCALLELLTFFEAATLAVTLYALTRDEDSDLALLAFACRLAEGVLGAVAAVGTMRLASVAMAASSSSTGAANRDAMTALGASLLAQGGSSGTFGALCFAVGSTIFAYLFLRARSIPAVLAWLGVVASVLLVVVLPIELAGFLPRTMQWPVWMPMLVFELTLAYWLIVKGTRLPNAGA
jgi:hypothetical protein